MPGSVITKNEFEQRIRTYELRIGKHRKSISSLKRKIKSFRKRADRFGEIRVYLNSVNKLIEEFTGVSVRKIGSAWDGDKRNAKNIFYKYTLDNGITPRDVAEFCGLTNRQSPSLRRREFTGSFKKNRGNRELYSNFLIFAKDRI